MAVATATSTATANKIELMEMYLDSPYVQFEARPNVDTDTMSSYINDDFEGGKIVLGGTGSGKSWTTGWLLSNTIYTHKAPQPNTPIWIGSQTHDMCGNIWNQCLSNFFPASQIERIRWRKAGLFPEIVFLNKDRKGNSFNLHFFSYEQGRKALQSANVWASWLDEQAPPEIIEEIWGRLRSWTHNNMFLYSLTPLDPDPWLQDIYERKNEPEIANLWRFYSLDTELNNHISEDWKKNYLDSLPPDVRLTRQYGHFASYRGAVYPEFTNDLVINPIDLGEFKRFIGIDFGYRNPGAVWMGLKDDIWYVINDMQLKDTMPDDFADKVMLRGHDHRHKVIVDYEDAISTRYFNNKGIATTGARKNVTDGINYIKSLMFQKKLYVFKNCKDTIRQLKSYQWKEFSDDKEIKDEVKKVNDHLADCVRYICYTTKSTDQKPWESTIDGNKPIRLVAPVTSGNLFGNQRNQRR